MIRIYIPPVKNSLIYIIIHYIAIFVHSPNKAIPQFSTIDCYESFSHPKQYFELLHNHLRGPTFLFVVLEIKIFSYIFGFVGKELFVNNQFKIINEKCPSSLTFAIQRIPIIEIYYSINIKPYKFIDVIAYAVFKLQDGFKPGDYIIQDMESNFGIKFNILINGNEYIPNFNVSIDDAESFIASLSDYDSDICVITDYNQVVTIRPIYIDEMPKGLITTFRVERVINNQTYDYTDFTAFGCINDHNILNQEFYFIDEKYENIIIFNSEIKLNLSAIYITFWYNNRSTQEVLFSIENIKIQDFNQHQNLPNYVKKIFMTGDWNTILCPDDTERVLYKSNNGIIYHAIKIHASNVSLNITEYRWVSSLPSSPCS